MQLVLLLLLKRNYYLMLKMYALDYAHNSEAQG